MAKNKRKQGEGTIRLRSDGRWEGRIVIGYNEKGNPKTKNVTAKTKYECEEKLKALKEELGKVAERLKPEIVSALLTFCRYHGCLMLTCGIESGVRAVPSIAAGKASLDISIIS